MSDIQTLARFAEWLQNDPSDNIADVQLAEGTLLVEHTPGHAPDQGAEEEGLSKDKTLPPEVAQQAGADEGNAITAYEA